LGFAAISSKSSGKQLSRHGALQWAPGARQQLVQDQAEIEDVGTMVDFEAAHLLTIL
jgi:hypothetical protein